MFNKVEAIRKIERIKLNIHNTVITKDEKILKETVQQFGYKCSIRTDRERGIKVDLPFYLISTHKDWEKSEEEIMQLIPNGMVLIIFNGHQYDEKLIYNMVYNIDKSGEFIAEFSTLNVPLRHMYRYPDKLVVLHGNLNDKLSTWTVKNKESNIICLRDIERMLGEQYMVVYEKGLMGKEIEISKYSCSCGTENKDIVYWQI